MRSGGKKEICDERSRPGDHPCRFAWRGRVTRARVGQRHEIGSSVGRLTLLFSYSRNSWRVPAAIARSQHQCRGLRLRDQAALRALPRKPDGLRFGASGLRSFGSGKREYTVRMMTDAILIAIRRNPERSWRGPVDALAVSLSSEFLAGAVEAPLAFRSAALVSPTGFRSGDKTTSWRDGTRGRPWLHALFEFSLWSEGFFRLLTSRAGIRYFLSKTWGSRNIDEGLLEYDYLTTRQPGAQHAPYYFVSGFLFSEDIISIYHSLTLAGLDEPRRARRLRRLHQQNPG